MNIFMRGWPAISAGIALSHRVGMLRRHSDN